MMRYFLKYLLSIILFCGSISTLFSQSESDQQRWNELHDWDGITPWTNYIIYSPYYLGPNALSVPTSNKGLVNNQYEIEARFDCHLNKGDITQDLFLRDYVPIVKNIIALEAYGVLIEHYQMDSTTVYERRTRNMSGEGYAFGDVYIGTIIQIVRDRKFPDLALRLSFRTASGNKLNDARFTDAPGYFFDVSLGKDLKFDEKFINSIRLYGMAGFYVWQMNMPNNMQNDAFLFGLGFDISSRQLSLSNAVEGYWGYMGNRELIIVKKDEPVVFRDQPVIYRIKLTRTIKNIDLALQYQLGIHDFNYQTFSLSFQYNFPLSK